MGGTVDIGELVVRIGGDIRKLEDAVNKGKTKLGEIDQAQIKSAQIAEQSSKRMAVAFTAAATAAAYYINHLAEGADQLRNLSEATGVSVEKLSTLKYVAESTGASFDDVVKVVKNWNQTLIEMSQNAASPAAIAIRALGLSVDEIRKMPFDQVFSTVGDALAKYENGINKSQIATAIFKQGAQELIPTMNLTSSGFNAVAQKGKETGAILSTDAANSAHEFRTALKDLKAQIDGLVTESGAPFLHWLKDIVEATRNGVKTVKDYMASFEPQTVEDADKAIAGLRARIEELSKPLPQRDPLTDAFDNFLNAGKIQDLTYQLEHLLEVKQKLDGSAAAKPLEVTINTTKKPNAPALPNLQEMREELDGLIDELNGLPVLFGEAFSFDATPFKDAMAEVDKATEQGVITATQAGRMKLALQKQEQAAILDTASMAASTLTTVFAKSKAASIAAGIINTAVGVTKALSGSIPPYNFIQAALVAAAGIAQVASIRSTSESGGGTSVPVGGGSGSSGDGSDGSGAPTAPSQTMYVEGFNPKEFMSGEVVADIAEKLLDYQRDGGQVVIKRK